MPAVFGAKTIPSRYIHWGLIVLTLLVLGAGTTVLTLHLREVIRDRIVEQHGEVLYAAAGIVQESLEGEGSLLEAPREELAYLFSLLKGIRPMAMRLFNEEGEELLHFPDAVKVSSIPEEYLPVLRGLKPVSRYSREMALGEVYSAEADHLPLEQTAPLISAYIPLEHEGEMIGAAGFVVDGRNIAAALRALNRDLLLYGCLIFFVGGAIIVTAMTWAFGRLQRANRLLLQRTESLSKANHQLALAAKTSAIGAVTAHLIHDLKSPLFGLEHFVSSRGGNGDEDREDWEMALDTTRRMQRVIADVVRMLQEEKGEMRYEITIDEIGALMKSKLGSDFERAGVRLVIDCHANGTLSNKDANLIILIATNLIQNALQATPAGGSITFRARDEEGHFVFQVQDTGPGLPPQLLKGLFAPCRSGKEGGTGLGLAISKQLANHMSAELVLKETSSAGTIFELRISREVLVKEEEQENELVFR